MMTTRQAFEEAYEKANGDYFYIRIRPDRSVGSGLIKNSRHVQVLLNLDSIFLVFVEYGKISVVKDNRPSHWKLFKFEKKSDWSSPINENLASPMGCRTPENKTAGGWFGDRPTHITVPAKKGEAAFTVEDRQAIAGKELDKLVEARVAVRQWVKF